jgi:hypothetical protein
MEESSDRPVSLKGTDFPSNSIRKHLSPTSNFELEGVSSNHSPGHARQKAGRLAANLATGALR